MKHTFKTILVFTMALSLSHCASMVGQNQQRDRVGERKQIGETKFAKSPTECPNGLVFAAAWHDAMAGNEIHFKAAGAVSEEPIDEKYDLYILSGLMHYGLDREHDYTKAEVSPPFNSMSITFSTDKVSSSAAIRAVTDIEEEQKYELGADIPVKLVKDKIYYGSGYIPGTLNKSYLPGDLVQSLGISTDGGVNYQFFNLPDPVVKGTMAVASLDETEQEKSFDAAKDKAEEEGKEESAEEAKEGDEKDGESKDAPKKETSKEKATPSNFSKPLSGTTGAPLVIDIEASNQPATMLFMLSNDKKHGEGKTYVSTVKDVQGKSQVSVPLTDVKPGKYYMSLLRIQSHKSNMEGLEVCVDVASGVRGKVHVAEPKSEEK